MNFPQTLVVGPFQCNCRILVCPETGDAALVDPGDEASRILLKLKSVRTGQGLPIQVRYLLHTHGHLDHVGGAREVKESLAEKPKIALHRLDEPLYLELQQQGKLFGIEYSAPLPVDHYLEDGEELRVGTLKLSVIHTPGHSPGSVCIRLHEDRQAGTAESLFSGDTLFKGSVGRTDLWGANGDLMFKSIRNRIFALDDDTRVCPGHGPDTTVGLERRENPFFK